MKIIYDFFGKHGIFLSNIDNVNVMVKVLEYIEENKMDMKNSQHVKIINQIILKECEFGIADWEKVLPSIKIKDKKEKEDLRFFINSYYMGLNAEYLMFRYKPQYNERKNNIIKELATNNQKLKHISPELSIKSVFVTDIEKEELIQTGILKLIEQGLKDSGFIKSFVEDFATLYYSYIIENHERIEKCHKLFSRVNAV